MARKPKPRTRSSNPKRGQPTKCTPERINAIVAGIEQGMGRKKAAVAAGISTAALCEWLARGRAGEAPCYVELLTRVEGARTSVVEGLRGVVLDLAHSEDPHVAGTNARWLLERLSPEEYGRRSEVTGPKGGAIQIAATVAPVFSDEQLRLLAQTPGALEAAIRAFLGT